MPKDYYGGDALWPIVEKLNFNRGNAVKYLVRAGLKPGQPELDDLENAERYIVREILRLTEEQENGHD